MAGIDPRFYSDWPSWGAQIPAQLDIVQVPATGPEAFRLRVTFDNFHVGDVGVSFDDPANPVMWAWVAVPVLFSSSIVRRFGEEVSKYLEHVNTSWDGSSEG